MDGTIQLSPDNVASYCWYIKYSDENGGDGKFHKTGVTGQQFSRYIYDGLDGAQVYCRITDIYGNKVNTEVTTIHVMK